MKRVIVGLLNISVLCTCLFVFSSCKSLKTSSLKNQQQKSDTSTTSPRLAETTKDSHLRIENILGIWTTDPNGPHADFMINKETYFIVDNDGQSEFPYKVNNDTITIDFPDNVTKGIISKAANDTLVIKWDFQDPITYVRWKN